MPNDILNVVIREVTKGPYWAISLQIKLSLIITITINISNNNLINFYHKSKLIMSSETVSNLNTD